VLGAGGIARRRTIPEGIVPADNVVLTSACDPVSGAEIAEQYGATHCQAYGHLLDQDIDAVYVATPTFLHHEKTHLLARSAAFAYSIPNASKRPLEEGSAIPHLYYCDPIDAIDHAGNVVEHTTLIDITDQMQRKTQMLACHASQREWLQAHHGMDEYIESMKRHSTLRGHSAGTAYAEAFVQHRGHAFPNNDLLKKLFCPSAKG
jgi:Oxidoreductase family, NAD-binding Rossmann fold